MKKISIAKCKNINDVRDHIDLIDEAIIPLLCERVKYAEESLKFKELQDDIRDNGRIEAIISRAKAYARVLGVSQDYIEACYRCLIDNSIREEKLKWKFEENKKLGD